MSKSVGRAASDAARSCCASGSIARASRSKPLQVIDDGDSVIVEQRATWQAASDEPQVVASVFGVRDGRVASVVRYPSLADALKASRNLGP